MTRAGIFGAALLVLLGAVLLGAVLLIRVTDHVGVPPSKTDHPPLEVRGPAKPCPCAYPVVFP